MNVCVKTYFNISLGSDWFTGYHIHEKMFYTAEYNFLMKNKIKMKLIRANYHPMK